jgi:hypothetical protein
MDRTDFLDCQAFLVDKIQSKNIIKYKLFCRYIKNFKILAFGLDAIYCDELQSRSQAEA